MARRRAPRRTTKRRWHGAAVGTVVLDSGAITRLANGSGTVRVLLRTFVARGWRVMLPAVVLTECLTGNGARDASVHRVLSAVDDVKSVTETDARAAAALRHRTGNPSVVDALVAELAIRTGGPVAVLTTDFDDISALVGEARQVHVIAC